MYVYPAERGDTEFTEIAAWEEDPAADESHILCPTWADALLTVDDGGAQAALMPVSCAHPHCSTTGRDMWQYQPVRSTPPI